MTFTIGLAFDLVDACPSSHTFVQLSAPRLWSHRTSAFSLRMAWDILLPSQVLLETERMGLALSLRLFPRERLHQEHLPALRTSLAQVPALALPTEDGGDYFSCAFFQTADRNTKASWPCVLCLELYFPRTSRSSFLRSSERISRPNYNFLRWFNDWRFDGSLDMFGGRRRSWATTIKVLGWNQSAWGS